jgi:hypothetical protein
VKAQRRRRRKHRLKQIVAWMMAVGSATGIAATQAGWIGQAEPKLVLQLSWAALFFAGLDALMIVDDD